MSLTRFKTLVAFASVGLAIAWTGASQGASTGTAVWRHAGSNQLYYSLFDGSTFGSATTASGNMGEARWLAVAEAPTRDELIAAGMVIASELVRVQVWDGSTWGAELTLADLASANRQSFDVAYESQSGRALIVYHNGTTGSAPISYRIWDGSGSWSAENTVTTPRTGAATHMHLAANPITNEMVLIAGNAAGDSYALVWDGTSWGNGIVLELFGGDTDFNIAYEQVSGNAMVVYADGTIDCLYRTWNGAWSAPDTIPAPTGESLAPRWIAAASHTMSNRIALGVQTWGSGSNSDIWLNIWNGSSWETSVVATTGKPDAMDYLNVDVAFERWSGRAMAAYTRDAVTDTVQYRLWTPGGGWTAEQNGYFISGTGTSITLDSDRYTNAIMASTLDDTDDVNITLWNGSSWEPRYQAEQDAGQSNHQPFAFAFNRVPDHRISGAVFEDVNYGGGPGRDYATAAAAAPSHSIERGGVVVELYDNVGNFLYATTTAADGSYSFPALVPGTYSVRVVNETVTSSRTGTDGSEVAIQTWRADGSAEAPGTGAGRVGGEQPASVDAPANNGSQNLSVLQAPAGQFTQSLLPLTVFAADLSGIDFGFNFDTIVNTNDAGQGSLRRFVENANLLTDDVALDQSGLTTGAETSVFMIPGAGDPLGRPADPNFDVGGNSEFRIQPLSAMPGVNQSIVIDGYTQSGSQRHTAIVPAALDGTLNIEINGDLSGGADLWTLAANNCVVGGLVINGGFGDAITITGNGAVISGNFIGTDVTGLTAAAVPLNRGVVINGGQTNRVGGTSAADRNLIAGAAAAAIEIDGGAADNILHGNLVGTARDGAAPIANGSGVVLTNATNTILGGRGSNEPNVVANSDSAGVVVLAGDGNVVSGNSIHSNGSLGINLGADSVTVNDPGDADVGPNGLQNFPVITWANRVGGTLDILGSLNAKPLTAHELEFFHWSTSDASGYGEGRNYIGSIVVNTNAAGDTTFSVSFPTTASPGDVVTATATSPEGTSEFSQAFVVTQTSTVSLIDSAGTSYPKEVSVLAPSLALNIALNNQTATGVMLNTSSTIEFSDGSNTYTASLANPTYIPPDARGFTVAFGSAPMPAGIASPASYEFTMMLFGIDDLTHPYADTLVTTGRNDVFIRDTRVGVTAAPLQVETVNPGARNHAILALSFVNGYATSRDLDTLRVTNGSVGPGTQAQLDAESEALYLFDDVDASLSLTAPDTVIAQSTFAAGVAEFLVNGTWNVPAAGNRSLIVSADIDSSVSRDGDRVDASVPAPSDIVFETGTVVDPNFSPLFPLDSFGELVVDGMMAYQVFAEAAPQDTIYAGDVNTHVATIRLPGNGYETDTVTEIAVRNYAVDFVPSDLSALKLFRDNGDGMFNAATDTELGTLVYSGDRFILSGLSEAAGAGTDFFLVADVAPLAPNGHHFHPGIPMGGIEVTSNNDGPIDSDVVLSKSYFIRNVELINVTNFPQFNGPVSPGALDVKLLGLSIQNNTLQPIELDTLRLANASVGSGSQSDIDGHLSSVRIYVDVDADNDISPADSLLVDGLFFTAGALVLENVNFPIDVGNNRRLIIAADIDSTCSSDGTSLRLSVTSQADLGFDFVMPVVGMFPMTTVTPPSVNGMKNFQIAHYARPDSVVITSGTDFLILDVGLPANGPVVDTLVTLNVFNQGTATSEHFDTIKLYADGGDAIFDYGTGDDVYLGDFIEDVTIPGGRAFKIQNVGLPLTASCGAQTRLFVATDIGADYSVGGTIRMSIPLMGVVVASDNDGPIDVAVIEPTEQIIPKPDQLTIFQYPVDDRIVYPGSDDNLNLGIGIYNGYNNPTTLDEITLFQVGTGSTVEIDSVYLYVDADDNGLFNPTLDVRIGALKPAGFSFHFENLALPLTQGKVSTLFASYALPLSVTDSVTVDLQLFDTQSIVVSPSGLSIQGDFPINSAGVDVVNGMVAAQVGLTTTPSFVAAAGDANTQALSLLLPANGLWDDVLRSVEVRNVGSAFAGVDITGFFLWKEGGGNPTQFDPINDIPIGALDWNGSRWKNQTPFNETVPVGGLQVYVTFGTTLIPTDGATVRASIGLGGIQMASGNDGPVDSPITNPLSQQISTDPLISVVTTDAETYSTGQSITVVMFVRNEAVDTLYNVVPSSVMTSGTGSVGPPVGPVPASIDLPPDTDTIFLWSFTAQSAGTVQLCAWAHTADSLVVSRYGCAPVVTIEDRAANLPLTLTSTAPAAVNRGQANVGVFNVDIDYSAGDSSSAPIQADGIFISVEDTGGQPVPPNQLFDNLSLATGGGIFDFSLADSAGNPVRLQFSSPVILPPGQTLNLDATFDMSSNAAFTPFRIAVQGTGDVLVNDANDGTPTSVAPTISFPWRTTLVTVNSPADSLLVDSPSGADIAANNGQRNLSVFELDFANPGVATAATEILTDFSFTFVDTFGAVVAPNDVIRLITIQSGGQILFQTGQMPTTASPLDVHLSTPLLIAPGVPRSATVSVDLADVPLQDGFSIVLMDSAALVVRDINDDHKIAVAPANPGVPGFPFASDRVVFQTAASGLVAQHTNRLPTSLLPGMVNIPVMDIMLQHQDSGGTSSLLVDSLAMSFVNTVGTPLYPGNYFDALTIMRGIDTLTVITSLSSSNHVVECLFNTPVTLAPSASDVITVYLSTRALYPPSAMEVRVEQTGIAVYDANDGSQLFGVGGVFPFVSGPTLLQLQSTQAFVGIDSRLPANVTPQQADVPALDLVLENLDAAGITPVHLKSLRFTVENGNGNPSNPATVIGAARLVAASGTVVAGTVTSSDILFTIPDSLISAQASESDTASLWVDITGAADANFRIVLRDSSDVEVRDLIAGGPIATGTVGGAGFPLKTNFVHILGGGSYASFTNYPNPFAAGREATRVTYYLDQPSQVTLKLYTVWGAPVKTLLDRAQLDAGLHQNVLWDGRNGDGDTVTNGVYYMVLEIAPASGESSIMKRKVGVVR